MFEQRNVKVKQAQAQFVRTLTRGQCGAERSRFEARTELQCYYQSISPCNV